MNTKQILRIFSLKPLTDVLITALELETVKKSLGSHTRFRTVVQDQPELKVQSSLDHIQKQAKEKKYISVAMEYFSK